MYNCKNNLLSLFVTDDSNIIYHETERILSVFFGGWGFEKEGCRSLRRLIRTSAIQLAIRLLNYSPTPSPGAAYKVQTSSQVASGIMERIRFLRCFLIGFGSSKAESLSDDHCSASFIRRYVEAPAEYLVVNFVACVMTDSW